MQDATVPTTDNKSTVPPMSWSIGNRNGDGVVIVKRQSNLCDIFAMALSSHVPPLPESWARGISYPWRRRENAPMVSFDATNDLARSRAKVAASGPLHDRRGSMTFCTTEEEV